MALTSPMYVTSDYTEQVSRIRHHLQQYRGAFLSLTYIDGTGREVNSAYDIWINLCLITSKVRPAFMVQWVDYMNPSIYVKIMKLLVHYRDRLDQRDLDYRLLLLTGRQGIIVTTYYSYYKNMHLTNTCNSNNICARTTLRDLYAQYISSDYDIFILGNILGYPAAGESSASSDEKYIYSIYVTPYGIVSPTSLDIMTNIYTTKEARGRLNNLFVQVNASVKLYDPDAIITVQDCQQITDPRIPKDKIHINRERRQAEISPIDEANYKTFIHSLDRKTEIWSDGFDRVFELGYIYNR